ncbi:unnamed protein product, partial [Discosporangium mesarthrocarpum]
MDTLVATMETMLKRAREELAGLEEDMAKKSQAENRGQTDRGVGDQAALEAGLAWRSDCLPRLSFEGAGAGAGAGGLG